MEDGEEAVLMLIMLLEEPEADVRMLMVADGAEAQTPVEEDGAEAQLVVAMDEAAITPVEEAVVVLLLLLTLISHPSTRLRTTIRRLRSAKLLLLQMVSNVFYRLHASAHIYLWRCAADTCISQ